ncbi:polyprotein [Gossypium australe]|uniref:Polyprotein n=1 Tax=Gossypium australe TaxID=47621 RepID=A0A5B6W789_9ROSI|nr:polyprotein [Gossypium australe]
MIPEWKWDRVTMDFVSGLPLSPKKKDAIWVVVDRPTKSTHFIPVCIDYLLDRFIELYISEIVRLHGRSEIYVVILEEIARGSKNKLEKKLSLIEFAYNNSFQTSIKMAPYEALYGRKCRSPETEEKVKTIHDSLKVASDRQKSYADLKRREIEFQSVSKSVSMEKKVLRFGRKGKLSPRFIGPYEIVERIEPVAYRLALPLELEKIHNVFHISMLRRYRSDPSHVISLVDVEIQVDLTYNEELIKILALQIKELRNKRIALVKVLWHKHEIEEATWEPDEAMRKYYLNLFTGKIFGDGNP